MSPALGLALLFMLIGAQAAHVFAPRRLRYTWLLLLAAAGVLGAELAAVALHTGGPALGVLHPVADAAGVAVCELAGTTLTGRRRRAP